MTVGIGQRLAEEMKPKWLRIGGYWYPRGGMPIDVFWQSGPPPEGLWLPDQGVRPIAGGVNGGGPKSRSWAPARSAASSAAPGRRRGFRSPSSAAAMSQDIDEHGLTLSDYRGWEAQLPPGDVDYRCGPEALDEAEVIA